MAVSQYAQRVSWLRNFMKKLIIIIGVLAAGHAASLVRSTPKTFSTPAYNGTGASGNTYTNYRTSTNALNPRFDRNLGTALGTSLGTNLGTSIGVPTNALGQPATAIGRPGTTALGQQGTTAIGQPGTTAIGQQPTTAYWPARHKAIGQQGSG